jgi:uncharacterized protein DUF4430
VRAQLLALAGLTIALLPLVAPPAAAASSATVLLRVAPTGFVVPNHWAVGNPSVWVVDTCDLQDLNAAPGVACCLVSASDDNLNGRVDGVDVLNTAASNGCISGWAGDDFGFGIFVTSVDGLDQVGWPVSWWYVQVNGAGSAVGISDVDLGDGDSLELVYQPGP